MNVGITCWSRAQPLPSMVAARLLQRWPESRLLVIEVRRTFWRRVQDAFDKHGWAGVWRRLRSGSRTPAAADEDMLMRRALDAHGWECGVVTWAETLLGFDPRVALVSVGGLSAPAVVEAVERNAVDILLNCGGGLFRDALIERVHGRVLNAHMGPLPRVRGMNALEWSVFLGVQPCVTLHCIDGGIDTGAVLSAWPLPVLPGDDMATVRSRAYPMMAEALVEGVASLSEGRAAPQAQAPEAGRQYYVMHPRVLAQAARRLPALMTAEVRP